MSTLKVGAIRGISATADAITVNASDGTCTAKITNKSGHNLVTNGAFQIAQRSTSSTESGYGSVDRFAVSHGNHDEAITHAQVALTSSDTGPWAKGFRTALQLTNGNQTSGAQAGSYCQIYQKIEGQNLAQSGWDYTSASSYITLSFWIKSSIAQNFYGHIRTSHGTEQLYVWETGSLSANTWTKITKTIPGNSNITVTNDASATAYLFSFWPFAGTNLTGSVSLNTWAAYSSSTRLPDNTTTWWTTNDSTIAITGVQLEVSDHATDFEHLPYGVELARCQRYFYSLVNGSGQTVGMASYKQDTEWRIPLTFPTTMRANPSMVCSNNSGDFVGHSSGGEVSVATIGDWHNAASLTTGTLGTNAVPDNNYAGQASYIKTGNSTSSITFSAEL
tara:strand:- start:126 stop:1298 length:1173 start_codon:yes stop_codon:yes gene_type:complete